MSLIVRPAELNRDRFLLLETLTAHLGTPSNAARFDWLYRQGAFGEARVWILTEGAKGAVVGMAGLFPRLFMENGKTVPGCVLGDFCLASEWRSLGPGLQLQRTCLQELGSGSLKVAYDFPSAGMQAIYRRLGYSPKQEMVRLAKPLRVNRRVRERVRFAPAAAVLSGVGNQLLRWRDAYARRKTDCRVSIHEGEISEEFTELAMRLGTLQGIRVFRSAAYLQWRFREHPNRRYVILTARREDRLVGYLVFSAEFQRGCIVDLFAEEQSDILAALIRAAVDFSRKCKNETLSVSLLQGHAWMALMSDLGFYTRETCSVMICMADGVAEKKEWFLTDGDRES